MNYTKYFIVYTMSKLYLLSKQETPFTLCVISIFFFLHNTCVKPGKRFYFFFFFKSVPLERDDSEEYLKREARAAQIAEEIESSSQYKARVALENDDRSEEEKYTAVQRNMCEREGHSVATR